jgi:methionyl-tRNA formyltransferase
MQKTFDIPETANVEYVYDGLMHLGAEICLETLDRIIAADGQPESIPQEQLVTAGQKLHAAPKIFKETCQIDWNQSAKQIYDFVRGLSPYPGAWTILVSPDGKETVLKIFKTSRTNQPAVALGTTAIIDRRPCISTANELLMIDELQLAGKKRMSGRDFLNGIKNFENYIIK